MVLVVFFNPKTAYEMRISEWSSDVCSSDLNDPNFRGKLSWKLFARSISLRLPKKPGSMEPALPEALRSTSSHKKSISQRSKPSLFFRQMGSIQTTTSRPRRVSQRPWIDKSLERRASIKMSRRLHAAFSTTSIFRKLPPRVLKLPDNQTHSPMLRTLDRKSVV